MHQQDRVEIQFDLRTTSTRPQCVDPMGTGLPVPETGKLPRITEVLALAIHFEEMIQRGEARDYADLARLGCVSRERISQIMMLRWLAPGIKDAILSAPRSLSGHHPVCEVKLRSVALKTDWREQMRLWRELTARSVVPSMEVA